MISLLALSLAVWPRVAQSDAAEAPVANDRHALASRSRGLAEVDGVLRAMGPNYKVDFRAGGFVLTPPLGADAPRSLPLAFELESVRVGGAALLEVGAPREPVRLSDDGWLVDYRHAAGVTERYEVRLDGIEQSFVFGSLPAERGELVVRARIATGLDLPAPGTYAAGLEFRAGERGGVRFGAVRGIDAAGREAAGELRFDGAHLELVLPADFVERAALPLVLDPLVGGVVTVYSLGTSVRPAVTQILPSDLYVVIFERVWAATDVDIVAQRLTGSGALAGTAVFVESSPGTVAVNPTGAPADNGDVVVAWQQRASPGAPFDIAARLVGGLGFTPGPMLIVANSASDETVPDAWGPGSGLDGEVLLVWEDDALGILGRLLHSTSTTLTLGSSFTVSSSANAERPAFARLGHQSQQSQTLVVWQQLFTAPVTDHDIQGRGIKFDGTLLTPATALLTTIGPDEEDPRAAGFDDDFAVVYERQPGLGSGDDDVRCRRLKFDGTALTMVGGEVVVDGDVGLNEVDPDIAHLSWKYVVAWSDQVAGPDYDVHFRLLGAEDCAPCDGAEVVVGSTSADSGRVELAVRFPTAASTGLGNALLVWDTRGTTPPASGDIFAQNIATTSGGGAEVNLGGGCGQAGAISYQGNAAVGHPAQSVFLSSPGPGATIAFLNVATGAPPVTCGACIWEPFSPLVFARPVSGGFASYKLDVPCSPGLIGVALRFQWTVAFTIDSPCAFAPNISISDRLQVTYTE